MHKQTISITERHKNWLQAQVASGNYSNTSEVIRDMIRERELREQETPEQIKWLRAKLAKSIESGISNTDPADLLAMFKAEMKQEKA
ncbi:MAG: type II toxin-antitoxin system ParD family antitoxin [Robiginitomaculum sp.]|nr:MAG: type II toxin-antitoxin system ParD family antitoxin [Robiginitomaculum sp.]